MQEVTHNGIDLQEVTHNGIEIKGRRRPTPEDTVNTTLLFIYDCLKKRFLSESELEERRAEAI